MNNHQTETAVARGKAALDRYQRALASGSPTQIQAARTEMETSRRELSLVKAEESVFHAMRGAMSKSTTSPNLSKKAQGVRRPGAVPFLAR